MAERVRRSVMRRAAALTAACGVGIASFTLGTAEDTLAGFHDETYAHAGVSTEGMPPTLPVFNDQSAGSTLFVTRTGELYLSGMRNSGDGNGSARTPAKADPTRIEFPEDVRIVDAAGSSNDFSYVSSTSYMALDDQGGVWTWGRPVGGANVIGRGNIGLTASYTVGRVTSTADGTPLPRIVDIERSENQFLALDERGTLWSWGYNGENLPRDSALRDRGRPGASNATTTSHTSLGGCGGRPVTWHSIWGGNNSSAAVATNGLIYSWGFDNDDGLTSGRTSQKCPILNESANRALFQAYPEHYHAENGATYDESSPELNGSSVAETLKLRQKRYEEIVSSMEGRPLGVCSSISAKSVVDEGDCPVRQFGYSARAPRMLLQNGDLYTWQIKDSPGDPYGDAFIGRQPSNPSGNTRDSWWEKGSIRRPEVALRDVDYVVPGISAAIALTRSGEVYGWGRNNICQAVGARVADSRPCTQDVGDDADMVVLPTRVRGQGMENARITGVESTQCATWAIDHEGNIWGWGAGTATGRVFRYCSPNGSTGGYDTEGYKLYDKTLATTQRPFGEPIATAGTALRKLR
jgi:alpha-tubulin suppressor-like RCC1 family protein